MLPWTLGGSNVIGYSRDCSVGVALLDMLEVGDTPIRSFGAASANQTILLILMKEAGGLFLFQTLSNFIGHSNCERHNLNFTCVLCL